MTTYTGRMTEADMQTAIVEVAHLFGWLVHHDRPSQQGEGWHTAIAGDPGFPDLVLARGGEVIFVELKTMGGRMGPGQPEWLAATGGAVVRPDDLDALLARLAVLR